MMGLLSHTRDIYPTLYLKREAMSPDIMMSCLDVRVASVGAACGGVVANVPYTTIHTCTHSKHRPDLLEHVNENRDFVVSLPQGVSE